MRLFALIPILVLSSKSTAEPSGASLYPPGLLSTINRANDLLSSGQFNDAARTYSDAITQSPSDYLLYYKRATAYFSLNRHPAALDDFEKVLSLTSHTFDNAFLMKAKIHAKDGHFSHAREALKRYTTKVKGDQAATDLAFALSESEAATDKAERAARAQLWAACSEFASKALRTASYSVQLRRLRADCALAAGDVEGAVGDLSRLTQLSSPSTASFMRIFRLAYFLLPRSAPGALSSPATTTLKQCLHFDPDSKPCLSAHRLVKSFDKSFSDIDRALEASDWPKPISIILGKDRSKPLGDGFLQKYVSAMEEHTSQTNLASDQHPTFPLPSATRTSPRKKDILRALCRAYVQMESARAGERWCDALLAMDGGANDEDALVGKGEAALKNEQWEAAVNFLERAYGADGQSDRQVLARLQKAQRLLKQSKQKDYYKVLDVARDADARTIKKAFHKAARKAHPDKGGSEAKMAAVNEAYEVLSHPDLRARFDAGEDPNDPMAAQRGHPWAYADHPFYQHGSGGFQFHFGHRR